MNTYISDEQQKTLSDPSSRIGETTASYSTSPSPEPPHTQGNYTLKDYYALPADCRVELIDGYYFEMKAPTTYHQLIEGEIYFQLKTQIKANKGNCIPFCAPVDVQLDCDDKTMVQPDVILLCDPAKLNRRCIYGTPDFVAEIFSPSTRRRDMYLKLHKYAEAGVREYWMMDPDKKIAMIYILESEDYIPKIVNFDCAVPLHVCNGSLSIDLRELTALPEDPDNEV